MIEEIFDWLENAKQTTSRPWGEFFSEFQFAESGKLAERVKNNLNYFAPNYLLVSLVFLLIGIFLNPLVLIVFVATVALYFIAENPTIIGQAPRDDVRRSILIIGGIVILFLLVSLDVWNSLYWIVLYAPVTILVHSTLRNNSIKNRFVNVKQKIQSSLK
eukprot:c28184_g1_i1.p1 GENE.c28184_g1_i1~~c28184_g1_i1.p1  ORF type:complete len:160 (-),score=36.00 c28184_g1_i1:21-500(-)